MIIISEEQIKNQIFEKLMRQEDHIIKERMQDEYFNQFRSNISLLIENGLLVSAKSVNKFCSKLQLNTSYNRDQCLQGISEMIFWLYAIRKGYTFYIDKKLNPNNNSDVDIQIENEGLKFNIEIKTPNQIIKTDGSTLNLTIPFRIYGNKTEQEEAVASVEENVMPNLINNSDGKYTNYSKTKINDNKVIEYLRSGQTKFDYETNSLNVLVVALPSQQMNDYYLYLNNPYSGIFRQSFKRKFFDKEGREVSHADFDKVDVVYLTNMIEGHIRYFKDFNSWELENYCGVFVFNQFSQKANDTHIIEKYKKLIDLISNDTLRFNEERLKSNQRMAPIIGMPENPIFFYEYIGKHYKILK